MKKVLASTPLLRDERDGSNSDISDDEMNEVYNLVKALNTTLESKYPCVQIASVLVADCFTTILRNAFMNSQCFPWYAEVECYASGDIIVSGYDQFNRELKKKIEYYGGLFADEVDELEQVKEAVRWLESQDFRSWWNKYVSFPIDKYFSASPKSNSSDMIGEVLDPILRYHGIFGE